MNEIFPHRWWGGKKRQSPLYKMEALYTKKQKIDDYTLLGGFTNGPSLN